MGAIISNEYLSRWSKPVTNSILNNPSMSNPLVDACQRGHYEVAEYLVKECFADIERPSAVYIENERIEDATPLWCAASSGNLALVRLLIERGANVNSTTKTKSTPLRAACYDGHLNIVKYLIQKGADIELANKYGHTCLMIAVYRGHIGVMKYLMSLKVDANRKTFKGSTALHDCAENGSVEMLKLLIDYGAIMDINYFGLTPLLSACAMGQRGIFEYLIRLPNVVSRYEKIKAYELLGTYYVDKMQDTVTAMNLWQQAMEERFLTSAPPIPKHPAPPIPAYGLVSEVTDFEGLENIQHDPEEIRMQSLIIRERILGSAHPDTIYYIRYRGAVYADRGNFPRCAELWHYALEIQHAKREPFNISTEAVFHSFAELFAYTMNPHRKLEPSWNGEDQITKQNVLDVFTKAVQQLKWAKNARKTMTIEEQAEIDITPLIVVTLHLGTILTLEMPEEGTEDHMKLHRAMYELVRLDIRTKNGASVLHVTHNTCARISKTIKDIPLPTTNLTAALLKVGANPRAIDNFGNTPLHEVSLVIDDCSEIVKLLLQYGAHFDAVNRNGVTFEKAYSRKENVNDLCPGRFVKLVCLAARAVVKSYRFDRVPKHLKAFVAEHMRRPDEYSEMI